MTKLNLCVIEGQLVSEVTADKDYSYFNVNAESKGENLITIRVSCTLAVVCKKYLSKGSHVLVTGYLEGTHIVGKEIKFLPVT